MGFLRSTINYMCADVAASTSFYTEVLGMEYLVGVKDRTQDAVYEFDGQTPLAFAMLKRGDVQIMLLSQWAIEQDLPEMAGKAPSATASLFIEVDDVQSMFEATQGKARLVMEMRDTFYGMREFSIADPDGYILCFAQQLPQKDQG